MHVNHKKLIIDCPKFGLGFRTNACCVLFSGPRPPCLFKVGGRSSTSLADSQRSGVCRSFDNCRGSILHGQKTKRHELNIVNTDISTFSSQLYYFFPKHKNKYFKRLRPAINLEHNFPTIYESSVNVYCLFLEQKHN